MEKQLQELRKEKDLLFERIISLDAQIKNENIRSPKNVLLSNMHKLLSAFEKNYTPDLNFSDIGEIHHFIFDF